MFFQSECGATLIAPKQLPHFACLLTGNSPLLDHNPPLSTRKLSLVHGVFQVFRLKRIKMIKTLPFIASVAAAALASSAQAQSNVVFAVNNNQPTGSFGTINLSTGSFNQIATIGSSNINDIAYCPTNGILYGISNQTVLVKFNQTNGTITQVAPLSQNVLSLVFRPADGALFAASATKLFTVNLATGKTTPVGGYGNPHNLNKAGQNIRFASDGNLYTSNTSTNTDIYQIDPASGSATWMGEVVGYPYLKLQNSGQTMYGVSQANVTNKHAELLSFNLASFVAGGINTNGSTHQITVTLTGSGTNFPANFDFTGSGLQPDGKTITTATAPQLCCAGFRASGANQCVISWQSVSNQPYQLQYTTNIFGGTWMTLGASMTGTGGMMAVTNNMNGVSQCFFRMESQ